MPVIALANQKGGVAKTTTSISLGAAWAADGARVLLVDADPQAALTFSMGVDPDDLDTSLHDVLIGRSDISEILWEAHGCHLAAATIDLASAEAFLLTKTGREFALSRALARIKDAYDVILIDCPPSLGILTINALTAANEVVIPLQCESLSLRGMSQLLDTIEDVQSFTNSDLVVRGVIATMFDPRANHTNAVLRAVREKFEIDVLGPPIRKSIRFAEAPARGETVFSRAAGTPGARAYVEIARRLSSWGGQAPLGDAFDDGAPTIDITDTAAVAWHEGESVTARQSASTADVATGFDR